MFKLAPRVVARKHEALSFLPLAAPAAAEADTKLVVLAVAGVLFVVAMQMLRQTFVLIAEVARTIRSALSAGLVALLMLAAFALALASTWLRG